MSRRRRTVLRAALLLAASALLAGLALSYNTVRGLGAFRAQILTGSTGGAYFALAADLAKHAGRDGGRLEVVATAGSIENAKRLVANRAGCAEKFAFVQDGTPVSPETGIELLGRLPEPESLLLLARRGSSLRSVSDLRGIAVGIGPADSGTAFLTLQLLSDPDLKNLGIRTSHHELDEQARLVAQGSLDIAAYVMRNDAEFLRTIISRYDLDIVELRDLKGLIDRYPWLSLGHVPAGRFDLIQQRPAIDKVVPQTNTLVLASPCARRADRIELLVLLTAALPTFVRSNPPHSTSPATALPLATEARQFFVAGEPAFVDRYFPWLVNIMSPAYWIYLAMAATALFNGMKFISHFRLWRIDAVREKLEEKVTALKDGLRMERSQLHPDGSGDQRPDSGPAMSELLDELAKLRARCRKHVNSYMTPMGDEMFYRYQQSLIDRTLAELRDLAGREATVVQRRHAEALR